MPDPTDHRLAALIDRACGTGWQPADTTEPDAALRELRASGDATTRDLLLASLTGDVNAVRALLGAGASPRDAVGPRGWTPLVYLAYSTLHRADNDLSTKQCEVARALVGAGADPNEGYRHDEYPDTPFPPLYGAIGVSRHLALAEVLLEAGATPSDTQSLYHACEWFDLAPLQLLARYGLERDDLSYCVKHALDMGYGAGVRWFLEQGIDPNALHPGTGETTLHWAVRRGASPGLVQEIVDLGADPDRRCKPGDSAYLRQDGGTPLDLALYTGQLETARRLERAGGVATVPDGDGRLVQACARGDRDVALGLVAERPGAVAGLAEGDRAWPAHFAQVAQDSEERSARDGLALFLDCGFDANARGWMEGTPLHWAVCHGKTPLVELLLERRTPQVDVGGMFGTPLHTCRNHRWREADHGAIERMLVEASQTGGAS